MRNYTPSISVVCPVFNEENAIAVFLSELKSTLETITSNFEIIFCLDPSSDSTELVIENFCNLDSRVKLLKFSQRVGQPRAIIAGLKYSSSNIVIIIDIDGQDPISVIPKFIKSWQLGYDVVLGKRVRKKFEYNRIVQNFGYWILSKFSPIPIESDVGEFRLIDEKIVKRLIKFNEPEAFLRGLVSLTSSNQSIINFERGKRVSGISKYKLSFRSLSIGLNGIIGFTSALLNLLFMVGIFLFILTVALSFAVLISKLNGFPFPLGNPTIVILILLIGSFNILSISIIGLYVGRINEQVRGRPLFFIDREINF